LVGYKLPSLREAILTRAKDPPGAPTPGGNAKPGSGQT